MPGHRAPTLDDVARVAGVSRATASRAVRGQALVAGATQQAIARAIKQLGYVPNQAARSLATRQANSIGVIVPEPHTRLFDDPFFATTISGVAETLGRTEKHMVLFMADEGYRTKLERYLRGGHVDAALIVSHHDGDNLSALMEELRVPCMFVGRPRETASTGEYSVANRFVDIDNVLGGRLATTHLVKRGCRRIATITGPMDIASARERLAGFRQVLAETELEPAGVYLGTFEPDSAREAAHRLLDECPEADGIFVASDLMAAATIGVLTQHGRSVPGDVGIVGFDDAEIASVTTPPLTTVTNPWRRLAVRATEMLLADLDDDRPMVGPIIIEPELVVRQSA